MLKKFIAGLTKPDRRVGMTLFGAIAAACVVFDQLTKWMAVHWLTKLYPVSGPFPPGVLSWLQSILREPNLSGPLSGENIVRLGNEHLLFHFYHSAQYLVVPHEPLTVIPGLLQFWFRVNTGAAWSMWEGKTDLLAMVSLVISLLVLIWAWRLKVAEHGYRIFFALIMGGAIGNMIDRFRLHYVIDFIDFFVGSPGPEGHHYPTFNIADSAICVGIFLLVLASFRPAPAARGVTVEAGEPAAAGKKTAPTRNSPEPR